MNASSAGLKSFGKRARTGPNSSEERLINMDGAIPGVPSYPVRLLRLSCGLSWSNWTRSKRSGKHFGTTITSY